MLKDPEWNDFKKLISIVNLTKKYGSHISYNEVDPGIKSDIVLKFPMKAYEFITAIRCINLSKKVAAKDIEAFSNSFSDLNVDKMVIVASSGFDEDAIDLATNKDIELFETSQIIKIQEEPLSQILCPNLQIYDIQFQLKGSDKWIVLPEDKNLPEYLRKRLMINYESKSMNLAELLQGLRPTLLKSATNDEEIYVHNFRVMTNVDFPHLREQHEVDKVSFNYKIVAVKSFLVTSNFDPYIEEKMHINKSSENQITFDTLIEAGKFYYNPSSEFSFYCVSVEENTFKIFCVESYQHGELIQFGATQGIEGQSSYLEITDEDEINRLKKVGHQILSDHGIKF